jgi:TrpR-related protein YerC/YecD
MSKSNKKITTLADAILKLESVSEINQFLDDLCTRSELRAMAERWKVCQLLGDSELSYREIHEITGASLTTIGRVARFLREEPHGGYRNILNKIKSE